MEVCRTLKGRRYTNAVEACFTGNQIKVWHSLTIVLNLLILVSIPDICYSMPRRLWYAQSSHQRWKRSEKEGSYNHLVPCLSGKPCRSSTDDSWRGLATFFFIFLPALIFFFVSQMASLHFDGYAMEYVDYPAGMEWFLKWDVNLHRTVNYPLFLKSIPIAWLIWHFIGYRS